MAIILVTYDLKKPGQDYQPVWDYFKRYDRCKGLESVYLLDTNTSTTKIRDDLKDLIDANDRVFVVRLQRDWAAIRYPCSEWLNDPARNW